MTFGKRLTELRKQAGYSTRNEFAEKINIPSTTLRNYETDAREPGHSFLIQISNIFNVSVDYLLGITNEKERTTSHKLKTSEYAHIKKYRLLDAHGKEMVDFTLDKEYERSTRKNDTQYIQADNTPLLFVAEPSTDYNVNAAHERTDIEVTDEMKKHDDDIMSDDDF